MSEPRRIATPPRLFHEWAPRVVTILSDAFERAFPKSCTLNLSQNEDQFSGKIRKKKKKKTVEQCEASVGVIIDIINSKLLWSREHKNRYMMRVLIPIFVGLLNIVTSRTEPVHFFDGRIVNGVDRGNGIDMFSQSGSWNAGPKDFAELEALAERHRSINFGDGGNDRRAWGEPDTSVENDKMKRRKIVTLDDSIDGKALEEFEAASLSIDEMNENELNRLSRFLTNVLRQPNYEPPLVIVEEPVFFPESNEADPEAVDEIEARPSVWKRSRYLRKYPWKRQNRSRHGYDYEAARFCNPTRDDVVKLLVALHDVRQGNKSRSVQFCKRRHSAGMLFTNIRFLGRRK